MEDNKDIQTDGEVKEETVEKTFTQQDLDNSFNAGVRKANSEWQKDEKYKEFLAWKKSSQNDGEKINELTNQNTELANQNSALTKEIERLNAQIKVDSSDVKKEFSEFVTTKVLANVTETVDFDRALKEFKKNNPQYFGEMQIKKTQTAPTLSGISQPNSTNAIMNSILRGARD